MRSAQIESWCGVVVVGLWRVIYIPGFKTRRWWGSFARSGVGSATLSRAERSLRGGCGQILISLALVTLLFLQQFLSRETRRRTSVSATHYCTVERAAVDIDCVSAAQLGSDGSISNHLQSHQSRGLSPQLVCITCQVRIQSWGIVFGAFYPDKCGIAPSVRTTVRAKMAVMFCSVTYCSAHTVLYVVPYNVPHCTALSSTALTAECIEMLRIWTETYCSTW